MKIFQLLLLSLTIIVSGCVTAPALQKLTPEEAAAGTYPATPDYEQVAKAYFANVLKDPYSAQYTGWVVQRAYIPLKGQPIFGHLIGVSVNAKNSYGGYTGPQRYYLWVGYSGVARDASLISVESVDIVFP